MTTGTVPSEATILVVSKTRMRSKCCVGGLSLKDNSNVRLLQHDCSNQPGDTDLEIGQTWVVRYRRRESLMPPHIEDILVLERHRFGEEGSLREFLMKRVKVWNGGPSILFGGLLVCGARNPSWHLPRGGGVPDRSVGYWCPDQPLKQTNGDNYFLYHNPNTGVTARVPYVGYASTEGITSLPAGTLVRVSLARWWSRDPQQTPESCYLQISGWY